jgi:septum site-determining protein MinC
MGSMSQENVTIKGVGDGLLITLSPTEEWQVITSELAARIDEKSAFFNGARITIDTGARPVPKYELSSLKALLERRGLNLMVVQSESKTTIQSAEALDLRTFYKSDDITRPNANDPDLAAIDPEEAGTPGVLINRTLRSGRIVHSRGHVVILGDVNPGAKVIAAGDVIVWGKLRGVAHAGSEGDISAVICALDMTPMQLRIAHYISVSPQEVKGRRARPEIASVKNEQIVVEAWE